MTQNNFEQRLLKARAWAIVGIPLLAIFMAGLLIYDYDSQHDLEQLKKKLYACGKLGDQHMLIDRKYLFFARVEYQGVDYWGKNSKEEHAAKGCNDQIQNVSFQVSWPDMLPSKGFELHAKEHQNITFTLTQRGSWPIEWGENKNIRNQIGLLQHSVNDSRVTDFKISDEQIHAQKVFNQDMGLYQMTLSKGGDKIAKNIYWHEDEAKRIGVVIDCQNYFNGQTKCELHSHVPNYGFYTSYLRIYFHGELLEHWQDMIQDAETLIVSFEVTES